MNKIIFSLASVLAFSLYGQAQLTLSHDQCLEMAITASEDVRIAENETQQSKLDWEVARTNRLPRLSGSANGFYMAPNMGMNGMDFVMHGAWSAGLTLTQPIWTGGKITAGIDLAKIGRDAREQQSAVTKLDVITDADNAYWTYIALIEKQKMLQSMISFVEEAYQQVEASVSAGMSTRADQLRLEAKRSDVSYQMEKVINGLDMCRMGLCRIIGVDFDTEIVPVDTTIQVKNPMDLLGLDGGVSLRPEYQLLQSQISASEKQIKLTRADYLPSIALSGMYNWYGNMKMKGVASDGMGGYVPYTSKINDNFGLVALSVSIPLINWGEGFKKVKQKKIALENSKLELEKNIKLMDLQLRNAQMNLTSAYSMIQTAERGEEEATEALRVMQDRFDVGMCTVTDLLEAQSQWHSARSNTIEARTQYKIYETEYLRAAGLLNP